MEVALSNTPSATVEGWLIGWSNPTVPRPTILRRVNRGPGWDLDIERGFVDRARTGDHVALRAILERYGPILFRSVLLPRLGDEARAKDALADTYTRVVTTIARYEW